MNIIYALKDPNTDNYMYVGKSINGVKRAKSHLNYSSNVFVRDWVTCLMIQEQEPIIEILETCDEVLLLPEKEKFWINKFLSEGHPLLNIVLYDSLTEKSIELCHLKRVLENKIKEVEDKINNISKVYSFINISELVKKRRKFAGMSRNSLAEIAGIGKTVIYDIEKGKKTVRVDTLQKIFKALNIKEAFYCEPQITLER